MTRIAIVALAATLAGCNISSGGSDGSDPFPDGYDFNRDGAFLASWDVERTSTTQIRDYEVTGKVLTRADFFALQSVPGEQALRDIRRAAERASGQSWSFVLAPSRSGQTEHQAFLYRDQVISYDAGASTYPDNNLRFEQDPFSARFRIKGTDRYFIASSVDIDADSATDDQRQAIQGLGEYWDWLRQSYNNSGVLYLMGGFALNPDDQSWGQLYSRDVAPLVDSKTRLVNEGKGYDNAPDNIWSRRETISNSGYEVFDYPQKLEIDASIAAQEVSAHAPVVLEIN